MLRLPTKYVLFMQLLAACIALAGVNAASPPPPPPPVDVSQIKCDCNPCGCVQSPPPPPPPKPYCPPPPAPFFFVEGTPANNLYPYGPAFDPSSARRSCAGMVNAAFVLSGLIIAHKAIQGVPL